MLWRDRARDRAEGRRYAALLERARLTPDQACALGRAAAGRGGSGRHMAAMVRAVDGGLIWSVFDLMKGARTTVEIDDATGRVVDVRRHPGR